MKKNLIYGIGVGILVFTNSCINGNKLQENVATSEDALMSVNDTVDYHMEVFKEISPYFSGDETTLDTTFYAARYPVFPPEIDSLVRDAIFVDGEHHASQVAESFLGGFNEYAEEQIESEHQTFHAWFRNQACEVVFNVPGFLTLKNAISEYTGGAHGMEIEIWSNYDTQNKRKLSLTDLFQDTLALRQIVESHFRKQEQLSDTSSYGSAYFFDEGTFTLADNFGLTQAGLLFHYNPYEIKSYADGPTTLLIPYSALADTMTEKGKRLLAVIK
ncbi:DUF3298 and DUF4163 domain-containing protein [Sphingobacterium phlebotomi]|uniref:DUF3298 and DUF4163 domain-containing protein n=1 Tax=Sphingobacterium phlebotomi TaxID=2605433 RepID=A0A5D4GTV6_9SPHI|nr:DUF3298 and DUF4163 domain-containing protein [Sphingobacterium phlebotomi]TYR31209.1 DUF3298 and DUF4163 domain-containing protein [Sphingobacterium phlebotomi]